MKIILTNEEVDALIAKELSNRLGASVTFGTMTISRWNESTIECVIDGITKPHTVQAMVPSVPATVPACPDLVPSTQPVAYAPAVPCPTVNDDGPL